MLIALGVLGFFLFGGLSTMGPRWTRSWTAYLSGMSGIALVMHLGWGARHLVPGKIGTWTNSGLSVAVGLILGAGFIFSAGWLLDRARFIARGRKSSPL